MSETVHYTGKLVPVYRSENTEDGCRFILNAEGITDKGHWDTWQKKLEDVFYEEYFVTKDTIYKVEKKDIDPVGDIFEADLNLDCTINFTTRYYNGGCSFNEALKYALNKMEKQDK